MRLICGALRLDGQEDAEALVRRMASQMASSRRRPIFTYWADGSVALAVLDFAASQTTPLPDIKGVVTAADVRLDAPDALRLRSGAPGEASEPELLAALLESSGGTGLNEVLGDFAFARWNRGTRRLLCGRDIFGVRPFSYTHQPGKLFAFASMPNALHGSGIASGNLDEEALSRRLALAGNLDETLVADVRRLPPAHFLEVSARGLVETRYWQLTPSSAASAHLSPDEAARKMRRLVDEAVRCRLSKTQETGAHLSGGLDSSAISVLAARALRDQGRQLRAYSFLDRLRNDISIKDEGDYVQAVLAQEGDIDWTPIRRTLLPESSSETADPCRLHFPTGAEVDSAACAQAAVQGVGIILSGWGGDEAVSFNGRGVLAELLLRGRWGTLGHAIAGFKCERPASAMKIWRAHILPYFVPARLKTLGQTVLGRPKPKELFRQSLSPIARRWLSTTKWSKLAASPDSGENRRRLVTAPHVTERLEHWAQIGADHGLAYAFPLLDRRVVEFAVSLPGEFFIRDGVLRRPFRDAMTGVLPESVRLRKQKDTPFPTLSLDLAQRRDEFLDRIERYRANEAVRRVVDLDALSRLVHSFPSPERMQRLLREDKPLPSAMIMAARLLDAADHLARHS